MTIEGGKVVVGGCGEVFKDFSMVVVRFSTSELG
jgi:hypothetical protein